MAILWRMQQCLSYYFSFFISCLLFFPRFQCFILFVFAFSRSLIAFWWMHLPASFLYTLDEKKKKNRQRSKHPANGTPFGCVCCSHGSVVAKGAACVGYRDVPAMGAGYHGVGRRGVPVEELEVAAAVSVPAVPVLPTGAVVSCVLAHVLKHFWSHLYYF